MTDSTKQLSGNMNVLITGAGGFLGQCLASALMKNPSVESLLLTDVAEPNIPSITDCSQEQQKNSSSNKNCCCSVRATKADLTQRQGCEAVISPNLTHVYLLHGIMSGAAEANLELGLAVNVDSMRNMLDTLRKIKRGIRVIFPSSLAVFGPAAAAAEEGGGSSHVVVSEETMPSPQSSYGAQKYICEILLNDYTRRGLLDARIVRLPTIIVRPGRPSGAASSFCSGIVREPLNGERSVLPVSRSLKLWVCSTRCVVRNLLVAGDIPAAMYGKGSRTINLPGIMVTVQDMLDALEKVGGHKALGLIDEVPDESVARIVGSWPSSFNITKAKTLGFHDDGPLEQTIQDYVTDFSSNR